jgi:G3E family GTPase
VTGAETLGHFAEAARQAALADLIVVTKTDLTRYGAPLAARLDALNGTAPRRIATASDDPARLLFAPQPRVAPPVVADLPAAHTHGVVVFAITLGGPMSRLDFARALGGLARERGNDLLRVKGIVAFSDRPERPAVVQAAQHALYAPEWLDAWPDDDRRSRLVFIVHDIPSAEIMAHFAFAAPAPWRPQPAPTPC